MIRNLLQTKNINFINSNSFFLKFIYVLLAIAIVWSISAICNLSFINFDFVNYVFGEKFAYADSVEEATGDLEQAQEKLDAVTSEYNSAMAEAENLSYQVEEATNNALQAQSELSVQQKELSDFARANYRNSSSLPFLTVIFAAQSFDEFIKNIDYTNRYITSMTETVKAQKEAKEYFDSLLVDLNEKSDSYNAAVSEANAKLAEANALVESAKQNLSNAEDAAKVVQMEQSIPSQPTPQPVPEEGGEWKSGSASAYGGSTDPGASSTTATGAPITDNSMGVAIPISWVNYSSYFGRSVQIKVGSSVVIATINDCGGLGGRDLDLQPGVFKSFGYESCSAWGVRNIEYKIL